MERLRIAATEFNLQLAQLDPRGQSHPFQLRRPDCDAAVSSARQERSVATLILDDRHRVADHSQSQLLPTDGAVPGRGANDFGRLTCNDGKRFRVPYRSSADTHIAPAIELRLQFLFVMKVHVQLRRLFTRRVRRRMGFPSRVGQIAELPADLKLMISHLGELRIEIGFRQLQMAPEESNVIGPAWNLRQASENLLRLERPFFSEGCRPAGPMVFEVDHQQFLGDLQSMLGRLLLERIAQEGKGLGGSPAFLKPRADLIKFPKRERHNPSGVANGCRPSWVAPVARLRPKVASSKRVVILMSPLAPFTTLRCPADPGASMSRELVESLEDYLPKLIRLADRNISERFKGKIEAEDVAASVCRTFIRHYGNSDFHIDNDEDLWKLLVTITLTKTRNKVRHHTAEKRDVGREYALDQPGLVAALNSPPGPDEAAEFVDTLTVLQERLDDEVASKVLQLLLEGEKQVDIAKKLNIVPRTVQRKKAMIQEELGGMNLLNVPDE